MGDYEPRDFIAYYLAAIFVRQMTGVWIVWDMDYQIRQGEFSNLLLRPINPLHHWAVVAMGSKWLRLVILLPTLGTAAYLLDVRYALDPLNVTLFITTIFNAWLLSFFIQYMNGLLAFWITQAVAVFDLWFGLWSLFSGYLIPLDLMPRVVQDLAFWLPFRYQLAVPLEIILGRLQGADLWIGLGMQLAWIAIAYVLSRMMWQRGLRKYSAVGA